MKQGAVRWRYPPRDIIRTYIILFGTIFLFVGTVRLLLPAEEDLQIGRRADGAARFVLVPIREAATMPTIFMAVIVACIVIAKFTPPAPQTEAVPNQASPSWGESRIGHRIGLGILYAVTASCLLGLGYITYLALISYPLFGIRAVNVDAEEVQVQSLLREWTFSREEVVDVRVEHGSLYKGNRHRTLIIRLVDGTEFASLECKYPIDSPRLQQFEELGLALKAELLPQDE